MHKAFPLPVIEFPLPVEVPASKESSHCPKKRKATAVKITLLLKSKRNYQSKSYDSYTKDSYVVPTSAETTDTSSDGISKKKGRTVTVTADNIQKRKNDIDEDDMEEMDIKWNMALLSMRADKFWKKTRKKISIQGTDVTGFDKLKVECFNCYKMGHFARECRAPISQDRGRRDNYRQGSKVKEQAPKALMAIDGVGWDWIYMANDEENHALVAEKEAPTEISLMANTSAESKIFDTSLCSKDIQLQAKEYDLMAAAVDLDEIEKVNANYILMANLQQASSS
nr:hypothetical protein [Tanacetum cinerariifolium]